MTTMTDAELNKAVQERADKAPRVTPEQIEREIASEHYFLAGDGIYGNARKRGDYECQSFPGALDLLTFCVLTLRNGFTVTGQSACASPENFDSTIGEQYARRDAIRQCWPLLGFRLRDQLTAQGETQQSSLI